MSVDEAGTERGDGGADEPGWDVDPDDESGVAVVAAVGRQIKAWRESAGLRACEFGAAIGYGEDLAYKVEGGRRIPRPEFLDRADEVLGAGGKLAMMKRDVVEARYPKKVRDLARMEARAVEVGVYADHGIHGLLQTEGHARVLLETRQPSYFQDEVERGVAARMARRSIFDRSPAPALSFVQEEAALRRPIGGRMEWRRQLERLVEVGLLRNVSLQVMPLNCESHPGLDGGIEMLKFGDGAAVGRSGGAFNGRPVSDPKHFRVLDLRCGHDPGPGSRAGGVTGLHRASAGRDMIRKSSAGDPSDPEWFKSSYSDSSSGNNCIEVASASGTVHVRDSKNAQGPQLGFTPGAWTNFVTYASES